MKPIYKKILIGFAIIAGIYILAIIGIVGNVEYKKFKEKRSIKQWEESLKKPYKEDVYGGKTPEQTWQMFLTALKNNDIELASKYFVVEKQEEIKNRLQESIKLNRFESAIEKLSGKLIREKNYLQDKRAYFYIPIKNSEGEIEAYSVIFYLNPYTKVWKILTL